MLAPTGAVWCFCRQNPRADSAVPWLFFLLLVKLLPAREARPSPAEFTSLSPFLFLLLVPLALSGLGPGAAYHISWLPDPLCQSSISARLTPFTNPCPPLSSGCPSQGPSNFPIYILGGMEVPSLPLSFSDLLLPWHLINNVPKDPQRGQVGLVPGPPHIMGASSSRVLLCRRQYNPACLGPGCRLCPHCVPYSPTPSGLRQPVKLYGGREIEIVD